MVLRDCTFRFGRRSAAVAAVMVVALLRVRKMAFAKALPNYLYTGRGTPVNRTAPKSAFVQVHSFGIVVANSVPDCALYCGCDNCT